MDVVIKIPEQYYTIIKHTVEHGGDFLPFEVIANGTPLLQGHDTMFSRKALENWLYSICLNNVGTEFAKHVEEIVTRLDGFERYCKDFNLPIIEADKEGE